MLVGKDSSLSSVSSSSRSSSWDMSELNSRTKNIRRGDGGGANTGATMNNHSNNNDGSNEGDGYKADEEEDRNYAGSSVDDEFKSSFSGLWESENKTRGKYRRKRSKQRNKKDKKVITNKNCNTRNIKRALSTTVEEDNDNDNEKGENEEEEEDNEEATEEQSTIQENTQQGDLGEIGLSEEQESDYTPKCGCISVVCCKCNKKCLIVWIAVLGILLLTIIGTYVGLCVTQNKCTLGNHVGPYPEPSNTSDPAPPVVTPSPEPPTEEYQIARQSDIQTELVKLMESDNDVVKNYETVLTQLQNSSQYEAFEWIVKEDLQQVPTSSTNSEIGDDSSRSVSRLAQRYSLAVLYYSAMATRMGNTNAIRSKLHETWLSNEHECLWEGVICNPPYNSNPLVLESTTTAKSMPPLAKPEDVLDTELRSKSGVERARKHEKEDEGTIGRGRRQLLLRTLLPQNDAALDIDNLVQEAFIAEQGGGAGRGPTHRIVGLDLSNKGLRGVVPLELKLLTKLETLDLSDNNLTALDSNWDKFGLVSNNFLPNLHMLRLGNNPGLQGTLHVYDEKAMAAQMQEIDVRNTGLTVQVHAGGASGSNAISNQSESESGFFQAPCLLIEQSILLLNDGKLNATIAGCLSTEGNETTPIVSTNTSSPLQNITTVQNETDLLAMILGQAIFSEGNQTVNATATATDTSPINNTHLNGNAIVSVTDPIDESVIFEGNATSTIAVITSPTNGTIYGDGIVGNHTNETDPIFAEAVHAEEGYNVPNATATPP